MPVTRSALLAGGHSAASGLDQFFGTGSLRSPQAGVRFSVMRVIFRTTCLAVAVMAITGSGAVAAPKPTDDVIVKRSMRIDPPFVPAIDPDSVPGYTKTMRGDRIAYCRSEQKIGTRFKTETCIDQAHISDYLAALEENRRQLRRIRSSDNRIN